jgi:hypothetical protein
VQHDAERRGLQLREQQRLELDPRAGQPCVLGIGRLRDGADLALSP